MNTGINHLNLATTDVARLARFFEQVFDFNRVAERGNGNLVVLTSRDGFVLTLMSDKSLSQSAYPKTFHVGILQRDKHSVLALHRRIEEFGIVAPQPGILRENAYGFYVDVSDGLTLEVSSRAQ